MVKEQGIIKLGNNSKDIKSWLMKIWEKMR